MEREYRYDNVKAFLIFCVVLGHAIECCMYGSLKAVYILIYSFHMPVFVFISGMFAGFKPERILKKIIVPYIIFQIISCVVNIFSGVGNAVQFTTPVWTLWYLPALAVWNTAVLFIDRKKSREKILILILAFAAALIAGYDSSVGYYLSLSRIIVFFPYFIMGYYFKRSDKIKTKFFRIKTEYILLAASAAALVLFFMSEEINPKWLYGSYTYAEQGYGILCRAFLYICGIVIGAAVLRIFPDRETIFSHLGARSLNIYLLHGFAVGIMDKINAGTFNENQMLVLSVLVSGIIVWVFGMNFKEKTVFRRHIYRKTAG